MFGYRAEQVIGQPVTLLVPPERIAEENQTMDRLRRGESIAHYETVRVTKDGRRLDVALTISPVKDSQGRVVIGASTIVRADARGHLAFNPEPPGIYSIQDAAGHELRRVAVNLAASESDLRPVAPGEINITRTDDAPPTGLVAGMLGNDRRELWRFLLLAAVAVLFLEPLLANRSYS